MHRVSNCTLLIDFYTLLANHALRLLYRIETGVLFPTAKRDSMHRLSGCNLRLTSAAARSRQLAIRLSSPIVSTFGDLRQYSKILS